MGAREGFRDRRWKPGRRKRVGEMRHKLKEEEKPYYVLFFIACSSQFLNQQN